jgi:hypothetical protein
VSLHVAAEDATLTTGIRCRLRAVHGPVSPRRPLPADGNGYGPPRLLDPDGVRTVADALEAATDAELRGRFDAGQMQRLDIYPQIWDESDILDEYLMPNVAALREFYARAAARHAAVLIAVQ